jgi:hypothetical protein
MSRKLTIGMLTYDDHSGAYFSLNALRMYHPEVMAHVEFLVLDNNPSSAHGQAVKKLVRDWIKEPRARYIPMDCEGGTSLRDRIFMLAETEYVMSIDSHVLIVPGALKKLIHYFQNGEDAGNLLHGPLVMDDLTSISTHMDLTWRGQMWGTWQTDELGKDPNAEPFEIPSQGLGLFACRRSAWLGFTKGHRGFGGEEGVTHERFRKAGRKAMCLPFLRWLHRFDRPDGVPYRLNVEDRIFNYLAGFMELGRDPKEIADHFTQELGAEKWAEIWARLRHEFTPHTSSATS